MNDLGRGDEDLSDLRGRCVGVGGRLACHARFDLGDLPARLDRHTTGHQEDTGRPGRGRARDGPPS